MNCSFHTHSTIFIISHSLCARIFANNIGAPSRTRTCGLLIRSHFQIVPMSPAESSKDDLVEFSGAFLLPWSRAVDYGPFGAAQLAHQLPTNQSPPKSSAPIFSAASFRIEGSTC